MLPLRYLGAWLLDLTLSLAMILWVRLGFGLPPVSGDWGFGLRLVGFSFVVSAILRVLNVRLSGQSPGMLAFGIEPRTDQGNRPSTLYELLLAHQWRVLPTNENLLGSFHLAVSPLVLESLFMVASLLPTSLHPSSRSYSPLLRQDLEAFIPKEAQDVAWELLSFYYLAGHWPLTSGIPPSPHWVEIPYHPGPPKQFLDRVEWSLKDGASRVVLFGPRTSETIRTREDVWNCLKSGMRCPGFRGEFHQQLRPLLSEYRPWQIEATPFRVLHVGIPEEDQVQGLLFQAENSESHATLALLIGPRGTLQRLFLRSRKDDLESIGLFLQTLRSQRMGREVQTGRAWTNHQLSLFQAPKEGTPLLEQSLELSRAQALLAAKLSLEPHDAQAYLQFSATLLHQKRLASDAKRPEWGRTIDRSIRSLRRFFDDLEKLSDEGRGPTPEQKKAFERLQAEILRK